MKRTHPLFWLALSLTALVACDPADDETLPPDGPAPEVEPSVKETAEADKAILDACALPSPCSTLIDDPWNGWPRDETYRCVLGALETRTPARLATRAHMSPGNEDVHLYIGEGGGVTVWVLRESIGLTETSYAYGLAYCKLKERSFFAECAATRKQSDPACTDRSQWFEACLPIAPACL
jgi:hypothetical protein